MKKALLIFKAWPQVNLKLSTLFNFLFNYPVGRVMPSLLSDLSLLQDYFKKSFLGIICKFIPLVEEMFQGFQAPRGRDSMIIRVLLCRQPLLCYTVPSVLQAKYLLASDADCCERNPDTSAQIPSQK